MERVGISRRELLVAAAASTALAAAGGALAACTGGSSSASNSPSSGSAASGRGVDVADLDATGLAELVRAGEVSPRELVEAAIDRARAVDPELNTIIHEDFEGALRRAGDVDLTAVFAGVPFLLKDLGAEIAGQSHTLGNRALKEVDHRSTTTSELGRRFLAAGLLPLGRTNMPEVGMQATTQPLAYGPTRNPWDPERSTSGSSGGSAAAVAAGIVPMAHGNDGSGSIRVPAAWCGVIGLKPTRGRTPYLLADHRQGVDFALTRTVRDTAHLLDAVQGSVVGDRYPTSPPSREYRLEVGADPGRLRIGVGTEVPGITIEPPVLAAVEQVGRTLEGLGHHVEGGARPRQLAVPLAEDVTVASVASSIDAATAIIEEGLGRPITADDVEPYFWALVTSVVADEQHRAAARVDEQAWVDHVAGWWDETGTDVLLLPTVRTPALTLRELEVDAADPVATLYQAGSLMALTHPFNVTGEPAISLPLAATAEGLPIGIQLVAPVGGEPVLLRLAAQLEEAMPWRDRRPPIHATAEG